MPTKQKPTERQYIINLRREILKVPRYKRTPKAIKAIKQFIAKHMRIPDRDVSKVKLDKYLNQEIWFRGIKNPITKVKVKAKYQDENVIVELVELPKKWQFVKAREDKKTLEAKKIKKKKEAEKKPEEEKKEKKTEEEKKQEQEKTKAGAEAEKKMAETQAKQQKHVAKAQKQPKVQPQRKALEK